MKSTKVLQTEDYWAIWLGFLIIGVTIIAFWSGNLFIKNSGVTPEKWSDFNKVMDDLNKNLGAYFAIFLSFLTVSSFSMWMMGYELKLFSADGFWY